MRGSAPAERLAYSVPEVARMLGVHPRVLKRYIKQFNIPSYRLGGMHMLRAEVVERYLLNDPRQVESSSPPTGDPSAVVL